MDIRQARERVKKGEFYTEDEAKKYLASKMYELRFDKKALAELNSFEKSIKERIWKKLQQCKEDPFRFLGGLEEIEGFKLRIGDYRVIIDVDRLNNLLIISKVGHRNNIYER